MQKNNQTDVLRNPIKFRTLINSQISRPSMISKLTNLQEVKNINRGIAASSFANQMMLKAKQVFEEEKKKKLEKEKEKELKKETKRIKNQKIVSKKKFLSKIVISPEEYINICLPTPGSYLLCNKKEEEDKDFKIVTILKYDIVKELQTGDCFGEIALINDDKRTATIICTEDCELGLLNKNDYSKSLKKADTTAFKSNIYSLTNNLIFNYYNRSKFKKGLFGNFKLSKFAKGTVLTQEGTNNNNNIYILKSGVLSVSVTCTINNLKFIRDFIYLFNRVFHSNSLLYKQVKFVKKQREQMIEKHQIEDDRLREIVIREKLESYNNSEKLGNLLSAHLFQIINFVKTTKYSNNNLDYEYESDSDDIIANIIDDKRNENKDLSKKKYKFDLRIIENNDIIGLEDFYYFTSILNNAEFITCCL